MGILSKFATNKTKEEKGTWVTIDTNDDGTICKVKILRMGGENNRRFNARFAKMNKKHRGKIGELPTEEESQALREIFVDTVLVDWENVDDIREKDPTAFPAASRYMPYTRENALLLLKAVPDFFTYLVTLATDIETFQGEVDATEAKN